MARAFPEWERPKLGDVSGFVLASSGAENLDVQNLDVHISVRSSPLNHFFDHAPTRFIPRHVIVMLFHRDLRVMNGLRTRDWQLCPLLRRVP